MLNCNPNQTPVDTKSKHDPEGTPISDPTLYRCLASGLQYLTFTRPNLSYALYASLGSSLVAYSDVDWAGCPATRRSTSRYCVFMEAEYRGIANVVAETAWLNNLLRELYIQLLTPTLVYCDDVSHVRVLHVPSRYQYADIFTKGLPWELFEEFCTSLSVRLPPA
ncbi:ribonuclease H-like domain-containing protein [Tanacetum coccineum]|uniref:Ribonuclease H-like domain-containing protein n=1 Tax=Tanacetum coccineum TaxID=301880 RepID=A0ABQ5C9Y8_9ASTR